MPAPTKLSRSLSLPLITLYGIGTIVGGGFYALVGKVAAEAGMYTPIAFLVAALVGLVTALSYGELSARYPVSAGESQYVQEAFRQRWLSTTVGWLVIATGIVSAATLANAFVGFFQDLIEIPTSLGVTAIVLVLGGVAVWGITESAILATVITCIEVGGILYIIGSGRGYLAELPDRLHELIPPFSLAPWPGIVFGAFLAFYALIGFEDMVNLAEEVKRPKRNLPLALVLALGVAGSLYLVATTVAVLALAPEELAASRTPMARVVGAETGDSSLGMSLVSMLAGVNGALVQLIMAARILYGMAMKQNAPALFTKVAPRTHTPIRATVVMTLAVLGFALWLPLVSLAKLTSGIILLVFTLVNLSLVVLKLRGATKAEDVPDRPLWVPVLGFVICAAFVGVQILSAP